MPVNSVQKLETLRQSLKALTDKINSLIAKKWSKIALNRNKKTTRYYIDESHLLLRKVEKDILDNSDFIYMLNQCDHQILQQKLEDIIFPKPPKKKTK